LFEGATFVLTRPVGQVCPQTCHLSKDSETRTNIRATRTEDWLDPIRDLITGIGAHPLEMTAEDHDRLIALTSHLPHVLALALSNLAGKHRELNERVPALTGGSFRSATRVAASSPELILDMLLTNRERVGEVIDEIIAELITMKGAITSGDETSLRELIDRVQRIL
jgi:prephenate dehydrogenase